MFNKVSVFQIGARRNYIVPEALYDLNYLDFFFTDIACHKDIYNYKLFNHLPITFRNVLANRKINIEKNKIENNYLDAISYQIKRRYGSLSKEELAFYFNNKMSDYFINNSHKVHESTHIYCFNTACSDIFNFYKNKDKTLILDQTSNMGKVELDMYCRVSKYSL